MTPTMQAWRIHGIGEPKEVLQLDDVPVPVAEPGHTILDVEACALNFPDILMCRDLYQTKPPRPFTPGFEVCGVDPLTRQRYVGLPTVAPGGLAEKVSIPSNAIFPIPDDMPVEKAAGFTVTYQTGYVGLHRRAAIQEGETLLVHAGAGGVGSAAIQLGVAAGARVIATAGGPEKVQICRDLGADVAIDYLTEDFVATVKDATDGVGADVVYDSVGGETFARSTKCIAFEGRIVIVGFAGGVMAQAATNHALIKNYSVVGLHWELYRAKMPAVIQQTHEALVALWQAGKIDPLIGDVVGMSEAPAAMSRLAARQTVGKVVVRMNS